MALNFSLHGMALVICAVGVYYYKHFGNYRISVFFLILSGCPDGNYAEIWVLFTASLILVHTSYMVLFHICYTLFRQLMEGGTNNIYTKSYPQPHNYYQR